MKFEVGENGRNPEKNLTRPRFVSFLNRISLLHPSGGMRACNRLPVYVQYKKCNSCWTPSAEVFLLRAAVVLLCYQNT